MIRAPLAGVLTVQGGPGTGKTAIGLHRAAYLLYNHPELARDEVMVVGPSRAFLGYIAQVLPSLGEEAVLQVTLADLVPEVKVKAVEPVAAQLVKGDARMARCSRTRSSGDAETSPTGSSCGSGCSARRWRPRR